MDAWLAWPAWKLLGVVMLVVGLARRWPTGPVVLGAGFITAWLAGMPLIGSARPGMLDTLGKAFVENRVITLYLLTLPAIGLAERMGLHAAMARFMGQLASVSLARVLVGFHLARVVMGALGLRLQGHVTFGRPIVAPMATAVLPRPTASSEADAKAAVAAAENYGNFFGQNLFPASAGCLLVAGVMSGAGYPVDVVKLSLCAIPIVAVSLGVGAVQFFWLERRLSRAQSAEGEADRHG
ncbi:MAG: DUF969 family protein [Chloracidobacterium sp.]|uniref:DUF969 domain-containing protein n=1 Tax=Chloracidobacterium validum TaxID=2821543 RepID=A0ABX8B4U0_9BACT|nr:DUF969 family protein [Chloracidobacterium validum]QUW01987.1 DUF969 domain-containing protein [Chloracidobacterium validum]